MNNRMFDLIDPGDVLHPVGLAVYPGFFGGVVS
jgi:hypothetical protein